MAIELPDSLKESIEELAAKEGYSIRPFMASAADEKLAVMMKMDYLRREAASEQRAVSALSDPRHPSSDLNFLSTTSNSKFRRETAPENTHYLIPNTVVSNLCCL